MAKREKNVIKTFTDEEVQGMMGCIPITIILKQETNDVYSLRRLLSNEYISITKIHLQGLNDSNIIEISVKISLLIN